MRVTSARAAVSRDRMAHSASGSGTLELEGAHHLTYHLHVFSSREGVINIDQEQHKNFNLKIV